MNGSKDHQRLEGFSKNKNIVPVGEKRIIEDNTKKRTVDEAGIPKGRVCIAMVGMRSEKKKGLG